MIPESEERLAQAVRDARGPLVLRGGGTRSVGRPVTGEVLELSGVRGISLYEPGALTLVAGAGTPLAEVEAELAAHSQRLPFEPMDHRALLGTQGEPTLGGMVAANASGPRRVQAGACRDSLIGVRFVDGSGTVIKNGGRVMKNVTGLDLAKLMAGSWGTLGVLSEVSFKLLPTPETQATLRIDGLTPDRAVDAMSAALGSPYEVNAAAFGPVSGATAEGPVVLRLEGFAASVRYRMQSLQATLSGFGPAEVIEADASQSLWRALRDVAAFAAKPVVIRLSIRPSHLTALMAQIPDLNTTSMQLDWGCGLVWLASESTEATGDLLSRLRQFCTTHGGHATLIKAPEATRRALPSFQPESPAIQALTRNLRQKYDPRGILNPGLMD